MLRDDRERTQTTPVPPATNVWGERKIDRSRQTRIYEREASANSRPRYRGISTTVKEGRPQNGTTDLCMLAPIRLKPKEIIKIRTSKQIKTRPRSRKSLWENMRNWWSTQKEYKTEILEMQPRLRLCVSNRSRWTATITDGNQERRKSVFRERNFDSLCDIWLNLFWFVHLNWIFFCQKRV